MTAHPNHTTIMLPKREYAKLLEIKGSFFARDQIKQDYLRKMSLHKFIKWVSLFALKNQLSFERFLIENATKDK